MRIYIEETHEAVGKKAALILASQLVLKPNSVLGLATGQTPMGMYRELIKMYQNNEIDFSEATTFNLDEYCGLTKDDVNSYYSYMMTKLFNHVNMAINRINIPDGRAENIEKECRDYELKIKNAGGIDIQILGIGSNGHIGFNEPDTCLNVTTHLVKLKEKTLEDNSKYFKSINDMPKEAISVGMATIMKANKILLLASGENKAEAIESMTSGSITTQLPASLLQMHHDVILVVDRAAGSKLTL